MTARKQTPLQRKVFDVIFGTETPLGKWFDIILIVVILASVLVIMLDSVPRYHNAHSALYLKIEWGFTLLFTAEYLLRLWCSPNRKGYALSAYGVVDLLALLPTYLSLFIPQASPLLLIRLLRILRIFRVLRLVLLLKEANDLAKALKGSVRKIFVFFSFVMIVATIFGCLIYVIEGPEHGFTSIPHSIYWAIVTITTVGYGDMVPVTALGQVLSAIGMLIGYTIIAVPTGIVAADLTAAHHHRQQEAASKARNCPNCATVEPEPSSHYCRACGSILPVPGQESGNGDKSAAKTPNDKT